LLGLSAQQAFKASNNNSSNNNHNINREFIERFRFLKTKRKQTNKQQKRGRRIGYKHINCQKQG